MPGPAGFGLALLSVLFAAACGTGAASATPPSVPGSSAAPREVNLIAKDYSFVPDRVEPVPGVAGREAWLFVAAGVTYFVEGDRVVERRVLAEGGEVPAVARH